MGSLTGMWRWGETQHIFSPFEVRVSTPTLCFGITDYSASPASHLACFCLLVESGALIPNVGSAGARGISELCTLNIYEEAVC